MAPRTSRTTPSKRQKVAAAAGQSNTELDTFPRTIPKNGSRIAPDSSNLGGRVMIMQERTGHYKRMATVHSTIDTKKPWGFDKVLAHNELLAKAAKQNASTRSKSRGSKRAQTSQGTRSKKQLNTVRGKGRSSSSAGMMHQGDDSGAHGSSPLVNGGSYYDGVMGGMESAGGRKILDPYFDLSPQQREIYEQFVNMLTQLGNSDKCRIIAHNAARDAEERQLLSDYTDVSNYFDSMLTKTPQMGGSNGVDHRAHSSFAYSSSGQFDESSVFNRSQSRLSDSMIRPSSRQSARGRTRYGSGNYIPPEEFGRNGHQKSDIDHNENEQNHHQRAMSTDHSDTPDEEEVDVFGNPIRATDQHAQNDIKRSSVITANTDDALDFLNGDEEHNDDFDDQSIEIRDEDLLETAPDFDDQDTVFHSTS